MHSRPTPEHRVPVSYSPLSSSHPNKSPRRRVNSPLSTPQGGLQAAAHDAATWLGGRVGHSSLRRWMVLAGLSFAGVVLLSSSSSTAAELSTYGYPSSGRWSLWRTKQEDDTGVPPRVDRSTLEKLRLLEIHFGADEDDPTEGDPDGVSYSGRRTGRDPDAPPLVAEIPEPVKVSATAPPPLEKIPADVLDERTCGARDGRGCQFLVPAWLGEQETKAQQHLYQLGLLALALNRTLVLPNVSKSRLGCCYKNPFDFYYSSSSLADLGIPTISQDDFVAWTQQRDPPPTAQVVSMVNAKATYSAGAIEIDSSSDPTLVPNKPTRNLCLRAPKTRLDFSGHSPLAIYPPEGFHKSEDKRLGFGESVINTLRSREVGSKSSRASSSLRAAYSLPDVLAFNYELRFPILSSSLAASFASPSLPEPLPFSHFPYAQVWTDLGALVAQNLSPFIAIHWRTETLTPSNLAPCAQSLLAKLLALKVQHPSLRNVILATDYPIESLDSSFALPAAAGAVEIAHSGTFAKVVTEQHHAAMRKFLRDFERQAGGELRLTTFSKEAATLRLPSSISSVLANLTSPPVLPSSSSLLSSPDDVLISPLPPPPSDLELLSRLSSLDSGLFGILDKEVVSRAELFVTGVPGVGSSTKNACAKMSSFTNQLVGMREETRARTGARKEAGDGGEDEEGEVGGEGLGREEEEEVVGRLWNSVAHFALNGEDVD